MSNADADEYKIEVDSIAVSLKKTGLNQVTLMLMNQQDKPTAISIPSPASREKEKGVFFLWGGNEEKIVYNNVQPTYQWKINKVVGAGYDTLCTIKMSDIEQWKGSAPATRQATTRTRPAASDTKPAATPPKAPTRKNGELVGLVMEIVKNINECKAELTSNRIATSSEAWNTITNFEGNLQNMLQDAEISSSSEQLPEPLKLDLGYNLVDAIDALERDGKQPDKGLEILKEFRQRILAKLDMEIIPVEPCETNVDSRLHSIHRIESGNYPEGVVVEVIQNGIRNATTKQTIRKAAVVRGGIEQWKGSAPATRQATTRTRPAASDTKPAATPPKAPTLKPVRQQRKQPKTPLRNLVSSVDLSPGETRRRRDESSRPQEPPKVSPEHTPVGQPEAFDSSGVEWTLQQLQLILENAQNVQSELSTISQHAKQPYSELKTTAQNIDGLYKQTEQLLAQTRQRHSEINQLRECKNEPEKQVDKPENEQPEVGETVAQKTSEPEQIKPLTKEWETFKQQSQRQYDELKHSIGEFKNNIAQLQDATVQNVLQYLQTDESHQQKAQEILDALGETFEVAQNKVQESQKYHEEIQGYREEIESERSESQRLAKVIGQNLEKGLGYLKDIEQARDASFEIKAEISEEVLEKAQQAITQAAEKQKQLEDRLKQLDEFEYRDLEHKKQEIARQVQQAADVLQKDYLEKTASSDAGAPSSQQQIETLSAILSQITSFKNDLVKTDYSEDAIPPTVTAVEYLLNETLQALQAPLPKFIPPDVPSPKEHEQQQANELAQMASTEAPPEKLSPEQNYTEYVRQEYWNALLEYKEKLSESNLEEHLREALSKVDGVLKNIATQLMSTFDEGRTTDNNAQLKQISAFFNNQYLPQILDLAGFEEIPINIGKTKADSRLHNIQGTKQGNYESGVVVEVTQRGLRRKDDGTIIRKSVVVRGEPA